ncbi:MAG: ATP-binding protein [Lachnospiraceae bacterium]
MKHEERKQRSITHQIAVSLVGMVLLTVLLCWFFNTVFLGTYYRIHKQNELKEAYQKIDAVSREGELETDEFSIEFERICSNGNIATIIMRPDHSTVIASSNMLTSKQFMDVFFGNVSGKEKIRILKSTENYKIGKLTDKRMNEQYLVLMGNLQDGNQIFMRIALESIKESAAVSNQFLFFAGLIACGIGIFVSSFVSKKMTAPLLRLTELAQRMSHLDFNVRYESKEQTNKEIDMLGDCMNSLSKTLETTISELKSANNELKIDIKKKNEIDEMRKEFLSNVSHELKTPLALIQGYAEGLQECVNDSEESRDFYCDVIIDEAGKMNRMVKKLLTLNQLEFGNDIVQMERFNLTELICGVIQSTDILLQQNQIKLTFGQQNQVVYAWADEFKVEEVITNYLSNAINHCEGEKRIDIKFTQKEDCVRVSVFNTGKPIPNEDLDNIWEKFYKVDKARTRAYGGSGIGLSIVKAIMESFHRECGVINHENGVEFWMELDTRAQE